MPRIENFDAVAHFRSCKKCIGNISWAPSKSMCTCEKSGGDANFFSGKRRRSNIHPSIIPLSVLRPFIFMEAAPLQRWTASGAPLPAWQMCRLCLRCMTTATWVTRSCNLAVASSPDLL
ncbi:hypothetical protein [Xanthomonas graminis]|uniref:hypothetical protein n=1 Tax=Xanthomonas graminis TaxID=3390026 RepID=UPI00114C96D9|nr:hypothetical protein [Xanthomonas translucens]